MAWPPNLIDGDTFFADGESAATLVWGTDGIHSFYVVLSVQYVQDNEIKFLPNAENLNTIRYVLRHGDYAEIAVIDNADVPAPRTGEAILLRVPSGDGQESASNISFTVINSDFNAAKKREGQRVVKAQYLTQLEGAGALMEDSL